MIKDRAKKILRILKNNFSVAQIADRARDPFKALIRTVLSQNTADINTMRAFENLSKKFSITPKALAGADLKEIEGVIMVAGLYRNKSRVIKNLSRIILEEYEGSLDFIYSLPFEEAHKRLLQIPGVGLKTADVVLLFCAKKPTLPIDTHVNLVSKRLGLTPPDAHYEEVRLAIQSLYSPEEYLPVHLLLISLGRRYCKARKTLCKPCPLNMLCPSKRVNY